MKATCIAVLAAALLPGTLASQSIAQRVRRAPDGEVWMRFASQPHICGNGRNMISDGGAGRGGAIQFWGSLDELKKSTWRRDCVHGPVLVRLSVRNGTPSGIRTTVGPEPTPGSRATDLGTVGTREAVDYLLSIARDVDDEDAIMPVVLADSVTVWPGLLALAREDRARKDVREHARHWVGTYAMRKISPDGEQIEHEKDERASAIFALAQQETSESVTELLRIARRHSDPQVRATALFWALQSEDPRALDLAEEILRRP